MSSKHSSKNRKNFRQPDDRPSLLPPHTSPKIAGILLWLLALIFGLGFVGQAGRGGEYLARAAYWLVGQALYALPLLLLLAGFILFKTRYRHYAAGVVLGMALLLLGVAGLLAGQAEPSSRLGGVAGYGLAWPLTGLFGPVVANLIFIALVSASVVILWHLFRAGKEEQPAAPDQPEKKVSAAPEPKREVKETPPPAQEAKPKSGFLKGLGLGRRRETGAEVPVLVRESAPARPAAFKPYPLELLDEERGKSEAGDIERNKEIIKTTLSNFGIEADMGPVNVGPTVTQYTLKPAEGVKLSKITELAGNLSLALAAHPIRIEAPIPGKALVGVEIPNRERSPVRLRNLLAGQEFQRSVSALTSVFGRDVAGEIFLSDIDRMPHLLVAGSTGAGKTIFLNSVILSLLQKNSPETLRLILVDPKRVEFSLYRDLPHLLGPIIYEPERVVAAISWLTGEMEQRFQTLSSAGARDINGYNAKLQKIRNSKFETQNSEQMPYILFIIDELADLMAAKGREVEAGIVRLAQLSRAVGIHLVLATQRPSVEVLTGLIKANITSRVALKVATQVDSRTILDMAGAEKLLGSGDLLYISATIPKPKRLQSALVTEREVKRVAEWFRNQPDYFGYNSLATDLAAVLQDVASAGRTGPWTARPAPAGSGAEEEVLDELYQEAKRVVLEARKASASLLQRRLRIGYARAARLLDLLEQQGIVGPPEGAKPRKVLLPAPKGFPESLGQY